MRELASLGYEFRQLRSRVTERDVHSILALALFALIAAAPCATARGAPTQVPKPLELVRRTLTNGLQVIVVPNRLAPVVTTVLNYRVGSDEAPPGFPGTAHALEHLMFRGSPGLSGEQLAELAAALGGNFNADTQQGATQYFFTIPAGDLNLALHIEAIRMRGLSQNNQLWNQERGAIEQEVAQDLSDPEYVFYTKLLKILFKDTPYAHDALGTRPSFDKTTGAALRKFHSEWYRPNNAILVISGDIAPDQALQEVTNAFGSIPAGPLPARPAYHFKAVHPRTLASETDLPYGMDFVAFRFPGFDSPDYAAAEILSDVLSSRRGELYGLVPEGQALSASFSYDTLRHAGLAYATASFPAGGDAQSLLHQIQLILAAQATNGLAADLVEAAKRRAIAGIEFRKNSVPGLAMEWSETVAVEGYRSPQDVVDAIRRVTVADVNNAAKRYLNLSHAVTAILKPQPSGKPVSAKGFAGAESFAPKETERVPLPDWAQSAVARLEIPPATLHPVVTNLPNGIRLIVQPEAVSDSVSVFGRIKNKPDVEMPRGQDGVDSALERLFSFGTRSLGRLAFQKELDAIGAEESAGADFSIEVLTNHFERAVELLADNELSPALPEAAFKILQPELAAEVAGELQSPGYRANHALVSALFPTNDPAVRHPTPATVEALTLQDVTNYYRHAFRPDLTTIVVIGNVTPERAASAVTKYFGDWTAEGPAPNTLLPPAPANPPATLQVPDASRVQDKVTLAQTLELSRTNADYYALDLGNHVLGGAFYATRLYRDLRKSAGLVYFVSSAFQVGLTRGVYEVRYGCDPPNTGRARAIIERDLREMRTNRVSDAELRQAKGLLLRRIPLSESSFESIADGWLARSELGLPLDEPLRAARIYLTLPATRVRDAFAKWIRPDDLVQVTLGPAPQ
jgi:zinc protease